MVVASEKQLRNGGGLLSVRNRRMEANGELAHEKYREMQRQLMEIISRHMLLLESILCESLRSPCSLSGSLN